MPQGYHHVTRDIRSQICALKATGTSLNKIASIVERHVSTISREIKRNTGGKGYRYKQADAKAVERRADASRTPQKLTPTLVAIIEEKLLEEWSPDQISGRLKDKDIASISHEAIYQHIWKNKRAGGVLYKQLRHSGKKYNKRSSGKAGRGCIPNRVDITERPQIVEQKARIGDWEGDTVISAVSKDVTDDEIQAIEDRLNNRPRKILGYKTPMEVMMMHPNFQTSRPLTLDG